MVNPSVDALAHASQEVVYVPVPRKHLDAVYQFLGQLAQGKVVEVPWPTDGEEPTQNTINWSDEKNCRRLRAHLKNKAALKMLDLTAATPEKPIYLQEVMNACECSHGEASSGLGALTKAVRKVFGFKGNWPAPFHWDEEKQLAYYVMTAKVAEAWKGSATPTG